MIVRRNDESSGANHIPQGTPANECIDWYHQGQSKTVEINGKRLTVRFVERKGRRGRISITAPPGATFEGKDGPSVNNGH